MDEGMRIRNRNILLTPLFLLGGKIFSFAFNALLGSFYGAGKISDAFIMAYAIPTILFEGLASSIISCYISIERTLRYESPEEIDRYNGNMTNISVLLSVVVTAAGLLFLRPIIRIYAYGFDDASLELLIRYSKIIIYAIPLIGAQSILRAHLQAAERQALVCSLQMILYSILIFALVAFYPNDLALAWAVLVGHFLCLSLFLVCAYRTGYRYTLYLSVQEDYIRAMLAMIFPTFLSVVVAEIASMIDKSFASLYAEGIVTSLTYGYHLSFAIQSLSSSALLILAFPKLADRAARNDFAGLNNLTYKCLEVISWFVVPTTIMGLIMAHPIIKVLFGHGNFSDDSVRITALVFSAYLFGVLPMCVKHVGDRICFALKKTNLAMITTSATVGANIALDYLMNRIWGYMGLAAATGISILIGSITVFVLIKKETPSLSLRTALESLAQPFLPGALMGVITLLVKSALDNAQITLQKPLISLSICALISVASYVGFSFLFFKRRLTEFFDIF